MLLITNKLLISDFAKLQTEYDEDLKEFRSLQSLIVKKKQILKNMGLRQACCSLLYVAQKEKRNKKKICTIKPQRYQLIAAC